VLSLPVPSLQEIFFHEQAQILHTLNLLRHSCRPPTPPSTTPHRLSRLIALFFAHTLRAIGNPATFLYPAASRFLLQRPQLDAGDVPLIYSMLYSSDEDWKQERSWVLRFLRDGMRSAEVSRPVPFFAAVPGRIEADAICSHILSRIGGSFNAGTLSPSLPRSSSRARRRPSGGQSSRSPPT
jgi:hypothetical protein